MKITCEFEVSAEDLRAVAFTFGLRKAIEATGVRPAFVDMQMMIAARKEFCERTEEAGRLFLTRCRSLQDAWQASHTSPQEASYAQRPKADGACADAAEPAITAGGVASGDQATDR